jgi:hypothetical protein
MQLLGERGLLRPMGSAALVETMRNSVRDTASDLVMTAMNFLGVPYRMGGNNEQQGFDCSGFTRHIFENSIGLVLPRRADEQATSAGLLSIHRAELKPGDLVFFNTMKRTFSHVGIYVGDDKFIHAPRAGGAVRIEDMRESYWAAPLARAAALAGPPATPLGADVPAEPRARPHGQPQTCQRHSFADLRYRAAPAIRPPGRHRPRPTPGPPCAICASRSPTVATSGAATACPRKSSTATTPSCLRRRC